MKTIVTRILREYGIDGEPTGIDELSGGNVNVTWKVTVTGAGGDTAYLVQKMNPSALGDPVRNTENAARIIAHLRKKGIPTTELLASVNGAMTIAPDETRPEDRYRVMKFLTSVPLPEDTPGILYEAGRAFGRFDCALADFDAACLQGTKRNFHNTAERYRQLWSAAQADAVGRTDRVRTELQRLKALESEAAELSLRCERGDFPLRVLHNDTKFTNILFTEERYPYGAVVIDMDTVSEGMAAYDFADSVRSAAKNTDAENPLYPTATLIPERFEQIAKGYLDSEGESLSEDERNAMAPCVLAVTAELAARYLADYLEGDRYFRISEPEQNLVKARLNISLAEDVRNRMPELQKCITALYGHKKFTQ